MSLVINTNLSSLNAQRQLERNQSNLDNSMQRLASGKRINNAADDAAGLQIVNKMTSQVRGLNQAVRNANDGISLIQTAEGALDESTNILQRIRELSVQSANGTYTDSNRLTLDAEVQQLLKELDRIAETTQFNGRSILAGEETEFALQLGADANQTIAFQIPSLDSGALGASSASAGSLLGSNLVLDSRGTLANAIVGNDVLINGQSLGYLEAGSSVEALLDRINDKISGVTAQSYVEIEASGVGTGLLQGNDSLSISLTDNDGGQFSFSVGNTVSLVDLAAAISEGSGNKLSAQVSDAGRLLISGSGLAELKVTDTTGSASGITASSTQGGSVQQSVVNGLSSYWMREAETLITNYFDLAAPGNTEIDLIFAEIDGTLTGDVSGLTQLQQDELVSDGSGGRVAAVWNDPAHLKLVVDLADFVSAEGDAPYYNDRIIAHELVHAVMAVTINDNNNLPGWFSEGFAELIHGADSRVLGDISANTPLAGDPLTTGIPAVAAALKTTSGSPSDSIGYSASYIAVKILKDEAEAAGKTLQGFFDAMEGGGTDIDDGFAYLGINWGGGTTHADFEAYFTTNAAAYITDGYTGSSTYDGPATTAGGGTLNLQDTDTGSVAGSDYGGSVLTASSVLPNTAAGGSINFDLNLPAGYSTGSVSVTAQLLLSDAGGDVINVERGHAGGLSDLSFLGLSEKLDPGVVNGVGLSDPSTKWGAGEIEINGVKILEIDDTDSLSGKVDAINALTNQTGVKASMYAHATLQLASFDYDHWSSTNYGDFSLNGVVLTGVGGASTLEELQTVFQNFSGQTGVSARIKGDDLVLEANTGIKFGDVVGLGPDAAIAFGHSSAGRAKILTSAADAANGVAQNITDGTAVGVGLSLKSLDGSAISLELGETAFTNSGLFEVNSSRGAQFSMGVSSISIKTEAGAQKSIVAVDDALEVLSSTRSELGAVKNRLDFAINNISNTAENTVAARSRIEDADFAAESARLSRLQVLQQAGTAMLAQANAAPQQILALLQ